MNLTRYSIAPRFPLGRQTEFGRESPLFTSPMATSIFPLALSQRLIITALCGNLKSRLNDGGLLVADFSVRSAV